ncbi:MAG: hypothetical protein IPN61_13800 [Bacteroidetes bacterium]|nr:hypothetical protein [Bacteroidota bacterium]
MKKLFLLIPATLILTISMAQDTKSDMSKKNASLDGKSFKITLTTAGSESINPQSGDKSGMNSGTQSGEMKTRTELLWIKQVEAIRCNQVLTKTQQQKQEH